MEYIDIILSMIKSLILGVVFVTIGVFLLPDKMSIGLLKTIKPAIINSKNVIFNKIVFVLLHGTTNYQDDTVSATTNKVKELEHLTQTMELNQKMLFIVESIDGIISTIGYLSSRFGDYYDIVERITEYLLCYSRILTEDAYKDERVKSIITKINEIGDKFSDEQSKYDIFNLEGEEYLKAIHKISRYQISLLTDLSETIKSEKVRIKDELVENKKKIELISNRIVEEF